MIRGAYDTVTLWSRSDGGTYTRKIVRGVIWSARDALRRFDSGDGDASAYSVTIPIEELPDGDVAPGDIVALGIRPDEITPGFTASDLLEKLRPGAFTVHAVQKHAGPGVRAGHVTIDN